jgi:L-alanine-DL-glutamate epimerase-like enolase superfamily enzyme
VPGSTIISSITTEVVELELNEPFGISGGSQDVARIAVVRLHLADGTEGLGEAAPLPAYNGERVEDALAAIEAAGALLVGRDAAAWRQRALDVLEPTQGSASARCALETALCDALARRAGCSLYQWFGGCEPAHLETDVTIPIVDAAAARHAAERWWQRGFRSLKLKVGAEGDLERVLGAHSGAPGAKLLLDANGGLTAQSALSLVDDLEGRGVDVALFEQPVPAADWEGLERVARRVRVALDESVVHARDVLEAARRLGPPHVVNVKLMKSGVVGALDVVAAARAAGLSLMIGGMLESSLAMSTSACFAAGQGGFEFVDLDTPLFMLDSPFVGGFTSKGNLLDVSPIHIGHGVSLGGSRQGAPARSR